jgi:hypothetical protein
MPPAALGGVRGTFPDHRQRSDGKRPHARLSLGGTIYGQAFIGADLDNRSLPGGVYVAGAMGRHAGFLTAASAAASTVEGDGPHLIYLPVRIFDEAKFLFKVKPVHDRLGRCEIALSEGIHDYRRHAALGQAHRDRRERCARQCPAVRHGRVRRSSVRGDQVKARNQARARRYIPLSPALLCRTAPRRWIGGRRAKSANWRIRRPRRSGGGRWLGGDPANRRLLRRSRPGEASQGCRRDQSHGKFVHRTLGERRHCCLPRVSAAVTGSDLLQPARLRGGAIPQAAEAAGPRYITADDSRA